MKQFGNLAILNKKHQTKQPVTSRQYKTVMGTILFG